MKSAKELREYFFGSSAVSCCASKSEIEVIIIQARAEALEEAAIKAENWLGGDDYTVAFEIAKAIRAIPNE